MKFLQLTGSGLSTGRLKLSRLLSIQNQISFIHETVYSNWTFQSGTKMVTSTTTHFSSKAAGRLPSSAASSGSFSFPELSCHYCCCLRRGQIVRCDGVRQFKYRLIRSGQNSRLDQVITDEDFAVNKRRETDRMRLWETSGLSKYHVDKRLQ